MNIKSIGKAYQEVFKFNDVGQAFSKPAAQMVDLYNSLSFEELSEGISAFENQDVVEVLDAAVDEFVIILGKLQILENAGFKVQEAIKRICDNNNSKYIPLGEPLRYSEDLTAEFNEKYSVYVLKDKTGKIRKPATFVDVDLSDLVPADFFHESRGES